MRKIIPFLAAALIIVLLGTTVYLYQKVQTTSADVVQAKAAEETVQNRYGEAINAIAEIQDSLKAMVLAEGDVPLVSGGLQGEQGLTPPSGDQAMDRIAVLRAGIERTKTRIRDLESSLKKSGVRIAGMQRMIAGLKQTVSEKEGLVAQLSTRVDSLTTQVTGLVAEVQVNQENLRERDEQLEMRRRELATIYYTIGTKKDLTTAGVVVAKGGVLGMGKTLQPSGAIDATRLTPLDTDQQNVVRTEAAKVQVLSAQPPTSYELQMVEGKVELRITDPIEFRKVKHLVLLTS